MITPEWLQIDVLTTKRRSGNNELDSKMKKLLPKFQKGFTLIELLIVIAIIAVLAAITIAIYSSSNPQQTARDSKRISDVNAMADGMESAYATQYVPFAATMLSTGAIPTDGIASNSYKAYCATNSVVAVASVPTWNAGTSSAASCPTGWSAAGAGNPAGGAGSTWTICTTLENAANNKNGGTAIYCRISAQK